MPLPHRFDPAIFREYDIRGIVGKTLHAEDAYVIARAFATKAAAVPPGGLSASGATGG